MGKHRKALPMLLTQIMKLQYLNIMVRIRIRKYQRKLITDRLYLLVAMFLLIRQI